MEGWPTEPYDYGVTFSPPFIKNFLFSGRFARCSAYAHFFVV